MIKKFLLFAGWAFSLLVSLNAFSQSGIVISQVYGGGGNSGATLKNDFIELFNAGNQAVNITGWSVQYAATTGTSWQRTNLSGTIAPGQYYLIQQAQGAGGTTDLPTPDAIGTIAMSASAGKVALVSNQILLTGSCPTENVVDFVGFGSATNCSEGTPIANLSNTTAAIRSANGCTDTGNNSADFTTAAPAPRNTAATANPCGVVLPISLTASASADPAALATGAETLFTVTVTPATNPSSTGITVTGDLSAIGGQSAQPLFDNATNGDATAGDNIYSYRATVAANTPAGSKTIPFRISDSQDRTATTSVNLTVQTTAVITKIHQIQGSGAASPVSGQIVTIEGIVVGDFQANDGDAFNTNLNGIYVQEEAADQDGNPQTSEGIFVFAVSPGSPNMTFPDVQPGDVVKITGRATEFSGLTQLDRVTAFAITGTAALPEPVQVTLPVADVTDFEQYEGMLVKFPQQLVIAEYFNFGRFNEIVLALPLEGLTRPYQPTSYVQPGQEAATVAAAIERRRILLDDARSEQNPDPARHPNGQAFTLENRFRGGDLVKDAVGIVDYRFNLYRIQPTQGATYTSANPRMPAPEEVGGSLKVAAFNVLNYFTTLNQNGNRTPLGGEPRGANDEAEFERQRTKIISAISTINADIVGLIEIQNNTEAIENLVAGLNKKMGAGTYMYVNTGVIGTDEIKVAFIYKPATVALQGDYKVLTSAIDPRFIDTRNRPALAQTFKEISSGEVVTVSVNHFKSKGSGCGAGDDDSQQGNCNGTRTLAAQALVDWLSSDPTGSGDPDFMIIGDLNAYDEEDPIDAIRAGADGIPNTADDFIDLVEKYEGEFAYSYVFDGQYGYLDHALASKSLTAQTTGATEWHINSDEPTLLDYDLSFKREAQDALYEPNAFRASDHDPVLVGLSLYTPAISFALSSITGSEGSGAYAVQVIADKVPYQDLSIPVTISAARDVRYGERRDYITNPSGETGSLTVNIPTGISTTSFTITPMLDDDNEKFPENVAFTLDPVSGAGYTLGTPDRFVFTILDVKKNAGTTSTAVSISPNPTTGAVTITTSQQAEMLEATLRSPEGLILYSGKGYSQEISRQISYVLQNRLGGVYHLQLLVADEVIHTRILKF